MTLTIPSFAKINWTLEILGRRSDGYHELRTLLQTISLADSLTFTQIDEGIEFECETPGMPLDETNLVVRAALLLQEAASVKNGVRIKLEKRIPMAAGLGGGSSNAAATILALEHLWKVNLAPRERFRIGSQLGSDVPFFFLGGTVIGIGRGNEVYPLPESHIENLLLVNAGIQVSTKEIYENLPPELTSGKAMARIPFSLEAAYLYCLESSKMEPLLRNDLEAVVFARYPLLGKIKDRLKEVGARAVLMSGSGSTIFALFDSDAMRSIAQQDLSATGWWCAPAHTLSRAEYWKAFGVLRR